MTASLTALASLRRSGGPQGITSVCSAHPTVLRAALRHGRDANAPVLIEATCNQVNHQGGYTGMTPGDFVKMLRELATEERCPDSLIMLGGDHLGPNPWRDLPAQEALAEAERMVDAYVEAGFRKIHLDASMGCQGEPSALDDVTTARRAARLAGVAENRAKGSNLPPPIYVIGTEVPPPGGADHALDTITPTSPTAANETIAVHRAQFEAEGLHDAFARVVGVVVQPGVEFGNHNVVRYLPDKARSLIGILDDHPALVFEAHSTDYQGYEQLRELVRDGFVILKVGPELTFVLREALYALDLIATDLVPGYGDRPLYRTMEQVMIASPHHWERHYAACDGQVQALLRHYSLSDRIRYYWTTDQAQVAVSHLIQVLAGRLIPLPLIWQYLPGGEMFADRPIDPQEVLIWRVQRSLADYHAALTPGGSRGRPPPEQ